MKDKRLLDLILLWLTVFVLPYIVIGIMHGFTFNINNWSSGADIHYILSTIVLLVSILFYKVFKKFEV